MNFKKISALFIVLSIGFTTETLARFSFGPWEDYKKAIKKKSHPPKQKPTHIDPRKNKSSHSTQPQKKILRPLPTQSSKPRAVGSGTRSPIHIPPPRAHTIRKEMNSPSNVHALRQGFRSPAYVHGARKGFRSPGYAHGSRQGFRSPGYAHGSRRGFRTPGYVHGPRQGFRSPGYVHGPRRR